MTLQISERGSYIHSHGTKVFLKSHSDRSQDAVAQAAFNEKRWVWVEDPEEAYIAGHILGEIDNGQSLEIALSSGSVGWTFMWDKTYYIRPGLLTQPSTHIGPNC